MRTHHYFLLVVAAFCGSACERDQRLDRPVEPATEQAPAAAEPMPPAELIAPEGGYNPDSLAWLQEGRPVEFDGRTWVPVGRPFHESGAALRPVGEFEGMVLYAGVSDLPPFEHLFFPYGNRVWQALEPAEAGAAESRPQP